MLFPLFDGLKLIVNIEGRLAVFVRKPDVLYYGKYSTYSCFS